MNMTSKFAPTCLALALAAAMAACTTTSPDVVSRADAQRMATVVDGVVLSLRPVVVLPDGERTRVR